MSFLIFVAVVVVAYYAWRVVDQLPDIAYRLSEIQRDVADVRRRLEAVEEPEAVAQDGEQASEQAEEEPAK